MTTDVLDFTIDQYSELLRLAKENYQFTGYDDLVKSRFILWRHDCDYSLNRALRLARLESEAAVKTTYFINPHCEFYNLLEKSQSKIVEKILSLGHDIGLHFDAEYYEIESEAELEEAVGKEAEWLQDWFDFKPVAFSFHNPTEFTLSCERESYGGLINCYSKIFRSSISYCSDSNGYWRHQRLRDVIEEASEPKLQVLTHPGWWQETALHPRQRIFRSIFGRAQSIMNFYDTAVQDFGRENLSGKPAEFEYLYELGIEQYRHCDLLWNSAQFTTLFIDLYRMHESQVRQVCGLHVINAWSVPSSEVDSYLYGDSANIEAWRLFQAVFNTDWNQVCPESIGEHSKWILLARQLIRGSNRHPNARIEQGCVYMLKCLVNFDAWMRKKTSIRLDGIGGFTKDENESVSGKSETEAEQIGLGKWQELKQVVSLLLKETSDNATV